MPLFTTLLVLLIVSRVAGEAAERLGQPAMIGEILAGILLGPSILDVVHITPALQAIAELGVFLLVLLAGMEMEVTQLADAAKGRGVWVAVLGFLTPLGLGAGLGALYGLEATRMLFLGLCLAITALPVSIRILMDLGTLHSRTGQLIVSASVVNDIAALLLLGVILQTSNGDGSSWSVLRSTLLGVVQAAAFILLLVGAYRLVEYWATLRPRSRQAVTRVIAALRGKETLFALTVAFVLLFATLSETVGLHFVVGTFFGGILLSHRVIGRRNFEEVQKTASAVAMGFLAPVFFALVGLEFDVGSLTDWGLVAAVLATAFAGKVLGGYWGGAIAGLPRAERWIVGLGLNGRGIMELVIANIALANGFIGPRLFSVLVLMAVVTTVATPMLLRRAYAALPPTAKAAPATT
ncbi:MAG: cation:proton antiporter [Gemmatimonadetes bacterium]|nr:cation:proton antiporter [Gemmatimonadota bacterium]MBI2402982.1 cation:proton antiporter [Gemmatimonadota bacterium]MBI2536816.1 cation:proton antiporter [Gemmatimonadota bacterium]MBI2614986.1 cation:proton antiporter [Gemmatimonadota bacterium]